MANVILTAGLGFGDEGKGATVDHLCRQADQALVVRYGGGPQAAHNVVTPDGRHHTFAQFGSGTFVPGTRTLLSRHMLVNPINLLAEERHLRSVGVPDALDRLAIEREALVINPFQVAAGRLRELARSEGRHGSCGQGIGEAKKDEQESPETAITIGTLEDPGVLRAKLELSRQLKLWEFEAVVWEQLPRTEAVAREWHLLRDEGAPAACAERFLEFYHRVRIVGREYLTTELARAGQTIIFEGAQGVLLDHAYGFFPHVTHGDTTFKNALDLLDHFKGPVKRLGILRAYSTRHGAGPFPTDGGLDGHQPPEPHNGQGPWQGEFRTGPLDLVLARYAVQALGGVDGLVVNHLDVTERSEGNPVVCIMYDAPVGTNQFVFDQGTLARPHDRKVIDIQPYWSADLGHRETLTKAIAQLVPWYIHTPDLLADIEGRLEAPVLIEGRGPTANDRIYRREPRARPKLSIGRIVADPNEASAESGSL